MKVLGRHNGMTWVPMIDMFVLFLYRWLPYPSLYSVWSPPSSTCAEDFCFFAEVTVLSPAILLKDHSRLSQEHKLSHVTLSLVPQPIIVCNKTLPSKTLSLGSPALVLVLHEKRAKAIHKTPPQVNGSMFSWHQSVLCVRTRRSLDWSGRLTRTTRFAARRAFWDTRPQMRIVRSGPVQWPRRISHGSHEMRMRLSER